MITQYTKVIKVNDCGPACCFHQASRLYNPWAGRTARSWEEAPKVRPALYLSAASTAAARTPLPSQAASGVALNHSCKKRVWQNSLLIIKALPLSLLPWILPTESARWALHSLWATTGYPAPGDTFLSLGQQPLSPLPPAAPGQPPKQGVKGLRWPALHSTPASTLLISNPPH